MKDKYLEDKKILLHITEVGNCGGIRCFHCPIRDTDRNLCPMSGIDEMVEYAKLLLLERYTIPDILEKE